MMNNQNEEYADEELEQMVLSHFVKVNNSIPIRLDYFTVPECRELFQFITKNQVSYKDLESLWKYWRIDLIRKKLDLENHKKFLTNIWLNESDSGEIDYLIEELKGFSLAREAFNNVYDYVRLLKDGEPQKAIQKLENNLANLNQKYPAYNLYRSDYVNSFQERYDGYEKRKKKEVVDKIQTGIAKLDKRITGVARSSLNFIQGETNIGKTFILQEIAYKAFLNGLKVNFITIEMLGQEVEMRWDSRVTGIELDKFSKGELSEDEVILWKKRMRDLSKMSKKGGQLNISHIPEGCTVTAIENDMNRCEKEWNGKVDLTIIDYADLMESGRRSYSEQESQGAVFRDLKRLSQTKECIIWTATQTSGRSYGKKYLDLSDTGYSKKKAMWGNLIVGISADEDDLEEGIINLTVLKNTFGAKNFKVAIYPDFSIGKIDISE